MRSDLSFRPHRCLNAAAVIMLVAGSAHADITGFSSGTGWTRNGSPGAAPVLTANTATLTNTGIENYSGSIFFNQQHSVGLGFTAQFTYQQTSTANPSAPGDGMAFVVQNSGTNALGSGGGGVGYGGIGSSLAVVLDLNQGSPRRNTTGLGSGGSYSDGSGFACAPVSLESGNPIRVNIVYTAASGQLVQTLRDLTTNAVFTHTYTGINLNALLGGTSAWVGFTGATGQNDNTQVISNFSLVATAASLPANWNVASGTWPMDGNWTPVGAPTAAQAANVANAGTCTLATGATGQAQSVNVRAGSTLEVIGTLNGGSQILVGNTAAGGTLTVRDGGVVNASSLLIGSGGGSSGTLRIGNGGAPGTVNAPVNSTGAGQVHFNHNGSNHMFSQPLSGSLALSHEVGTTTLSSPATNYTGSTTVTGGTLRITNNFDFNSPISVHQPGALVLDIAQDVRLLQGVSGGGAVSVTGNIKTARLAGNNSGYIGTFTLPSGTRGLMWSNASAGSPGASWNLSGQFGLIETPGSATIRLGSLSGTNAATQIAAFGGSGVKTLEVGERGNDSSFAGSIQDLSTFGGGGSGAIALNKVGNGVLTLTNTNTYTGGTTVSAGLLNVTGSIPNATVATFAALSCSGSVNGSLQIQPGAVLFPGSTSAPGTLICAGPTTLNGILRLDITGATPGSEYDRVVQTAGAVTLGATSSLEFETRTGTFAPTDKLFIVSNTGAGLLSGTFSGLPNGGATGTPVPALNGLGGHPEWRIYYGANQASGTLTGGNDIALAPTCIADFNNSGQSSVQDLFDFLAAFFANDPRADFNASGIISVQDLFDFLAAYFAGCP